MTLVLKGSASLLWVTAVAQLLTKNPRSSRIVYRVQALAEAALVSGFAILYHQSLLWMSVGLILAVKVVAVPWTFRRLTGIIEDAYGSRARVGMAVQLFIAFLMTAATVGYASPGLFGHAPLGAVLLSGWLVSFMHLVARYDMWSLMWALLSLETLSTSIVLVVLQTFPPGLDIAVNLAAWATATLGGYLVRRVALTYPAADVRYLRGLKG